MWQEEILKGDLCEYTEGRLALRGYRRMPWGWVRSNISELEDGNRIWQGSIFQERATDPYSTTGVETHILATKLHNFLVNYGVPKDAVVMDAGCADGRVTHLLLDAGMGRIVSTDLNQDSVNRLIQTLHGVQKERVLAIVDDFNHLPICDKSIDVLVSSGLLAEMPDFHEALETTMRMLKTGGLLFYFDPVFEQALLYALVRHDIEEFLQVARTSTRARMWDQKDQRYRVLSAYELEQRLLKHSELEVLERDGISILPSLTFGGVLQDQRVTMDKKQEIRNTILSLSENTFQLYRQVIYIGRKR
jgi:ubiquinone/menaquinone biosynthesis C-methylase UbiE